MSVTQNQQDSKLIPRIILIYVFFSAALFALCSLTQPSA